MRQGKLVPEQLLVGGEAAEVHLAQYIVEDPGNVVLRVGTTERVVVNPPGGIGHLGGVVREAVVDCEHRQVGGVLGAGVVVAMDDGEEFNEHAADGVVGEVGRDEAQVEWEVWG